MKIFKVKYCLNPGPNAHKPVYNPFQVKGNSCFYVITIRLSLGINSHIFECSFYGMANEWQILGGYVFSFNIKSMILKLILDCSLL